jgi:hypothetical protein
MRICDAPFTQVRRKFVRLYCTLRRIQRHSSPRDCAVIMEFILHDFLHSVGGVPTQPLLTKIQEIQFAIRCAQAQ